MEFGVRLRRSSVIIAAALSLAFGSATNAYASVTATLDDSCSASHLGPNDLTLNAIVPAVGADGCTIRWKSPTNPVAGKTTVTLVYGQPGQVQKLSSETIQFMADPAGGFVAQRRFTKNELGLHAFLTVLVIASNEVLLWSAWTVRATALPPEPPPASNQSLDIRLGALHLDNARGAFPPSRQTDGVVWQTVGEEAVGYEVDGDETGSPGIHVSVSNSWSPTDVAASSIKEALSQRIGIADIRNHQVHFQDLQWVETEPEVVRYENASREFERRHYYTIITVWTNASYRPIGGGNAKRFAHETSASTWSADDVTEWASYVRAEYSADPQLLQLIKAYTNARKAIPGFSHLPDVRGGDGGESTFSLRFIARLRPWAKNGDGPDDDARFRAAIESFSVVGSRTGLGTAEIVRTAEEKSVLCKSFDLFCGDTRAESAALPKGWYRQESSANLTNALGSIPIVQTPPQVAQYFASRSADALQELGDALLAQYRGVMKGTMALRSNQNAIVLADEGGHALPLGAQVPLLKLSNLPNKAYFVLGARLRAGALIRKDGFFSASYRMIPVNSYVQYVVRTSVIKDSASVLTSGPTRDIQDPAQLGKIETPPPPPGWFGRFLNWFGNLPLLLKALAIAIPLLVLMWVIAPLRPILVALGKLVGALFDLVTALFAWLAKKLKGSGS